MINNDTYKGFPNPCYILEEDLLRRNLSLIRHVADESGVEIILAFKAFALWKVFPIFREYISHTTASSVYEARLAYEQFGAPAHTYSPAYTEENWPEFVRYSSHITFNSLTQYARFYREGTGISYGIRVNPEYSEIETLLYNPTAPGSRFGILADELQAYCDSHEGQLPVGIEGFHCHCHCEDDSYTLERTLAHLEEKFGKWFPQLKWLNLGGGHLMTRKDYDTEHLIGLLRALRSRYPNLRVILEPGSAFAWQTGPLTSRVVDIVENKGIRTAILNVSFACHMPDTLEMPYQPAVRGAEVVEAESLKLKVESLEKMGFVYRLGGNSCLSGDWIGDWRFDHPLQIGEEIILEDMIHYTTVKTHMFNGISHPALGLLHSDGTAEVLRTFGYEDYLNRMD